MPIDRLGLGDEEVVFAGSRLFDQPPTEDWTTRFLSSAGHHLLVALDGNDPIGLASGCRADASGQENQDVPLRARRRSRPPQSRRRPSTRRSPRRSGTRTGVLRDVSAHGARQHSRARNPAPRARPARTLRVAYLDLRRPLGERVEGRLPSAAEPAPVSIGGSGGGGCRPGRKVGLPGKVESR